MSNGDAAAMDFSFDIEVQVCLQHFALPFHAPNWLSISICTSLMRLIAHTICVTETDCNKSIDSKFHKHLL